MLAVAPTFYVTAAEDGLKLHPERLRSKELLCDGLHREHLIHPTQYLVPDVADVPRLQQETQLDLSFVNLCEQLRRRLRLKGQ